MPLRTILLPEPPSVTVEISPLHQEPRRFGAILQSEYPPTAELRSAGADECVRPYAGVSGPRLLARHHELIPIGILEDRCCSPRFLLWLDRELYSFGLQRFGGGEDVIGPER